MDLALSKKVLIARKDARDAYSELERSEAFRNPLSYTDAIETGFDALLLPGGHDKPVRKYLESPILQQLVVNFFKAKKPVAAICHGVVLAARSIDAATKKSAIHSYKTTAVLERQELLGYRLTKIWTGNYYLNLSRTYSSVGSYRCIGCP